MRVRLEPVGAELDCAVDETILEAAFRQGISVVHGCREGQCSACKCFLLEGDVDHRRHSSFALSDAERAGGYALMCRAQPQTDLVVELLDYDPDALALAHPIRAGEATVVAVEQLTSQITRLLLSAPGFEFIPGQYLDLHVPATGSPPARRSFSIANLPDAQTIELLIRRYPGGRLSGMLGEQIGPGTAIAYTGPYGSLRLHDGGAPIMLIAGGSGLAPILSLLRLLAAEGDERAVRLCFAAREPFCVEEIERVGAQLAKFELVLVSGRRLRETVRELLAANDRPDVYMAGPPELLDAVQQELDGAGLERVFADRFTTSADAPSARIVAADERSFTWFEPRGARATVYEDVTVDTQPSTQRHLTRGWLVSFGDGRGTWDQRSTALRSGDWFGFRDPGERWEQPFYRDASALERELDASMRAAAAAGLLADADGGWLELLGTHVHAGAFVEHGLWFALATAARDCLSDTVAHCVSLEAAMKQRAAQAFVLHAIDLERHLELELPIATARATFLDAPEWQPTRCYLERLAATADWGEVVVAANLAFEPLVGTLLRRELGTRAAAGCRDPVTPVLARAQLEEWDWTRTWSTALSRFLLSDGEHGDANRATLAGWLGAWLPDALAALDALAPIFDRVPSGIDGAAALARSRAGAAGVLRDAGLGETAAFSGAAPELPSGPRSRRRARTRSARTVLPEVATGKSPPPSDRPAGDDDAVGIVISRSSEGDAIAAALAQRSDVVVLEQPAFWEVRARGRLVISYAELSERLGYELDAYSIQRELSTHYGRLVAGDEELMLFADPTEALGHLLG